MGNLPSIRSKKRKFDTPITATPRLPVPQNTQSFEPGAFDTTAPLFQLKNDSLARSTLGKTSQPLGSSISLPTSPPSKRAALGENSQSPKGYWQTPAMGKLPLDKFVQLAGGLSNAIAPDTTMGRVGGFLSSFAGQERRDYEIRDKEARLRRQTLEDRMQDREYRREDYTQRLADERSDIKSKREYDQPYRDAQIQNLTRERSQSAPSEWAATYNEYKNKINPETNKAYTTPEISEIFRASSDKPNLNEIKYETNEAFNSLNAIISSNGGMFDPGDSGSERSFIVPTDKNGNISESTKAALKESGFDFYEDKKITKTDKKGLFTGNNYSKKIFIGKYNPVKSGNKEATSEDAAIKKQFPGAEKADGKWYIRKADGKLYPIIVKKKQEDAGGQ